MVSTLCWRKSSALLIRLPIIFLSPSSKKDIYHISFVSSYITYLFKIYMLNAHISIFWGPPVTEFHSSLLAGKVPSWLPVASVTGDCSTNHLASGPALVKYPIIPIFLGQIQWNPQFFVLIFWRNHVKSTQNRPTPLPLGHDLLPPRQQTAGGQPPLGRSLQAAQQHRLRHGDRFRTLEPGRMVPGRC